MPEEAVPDALPLRLIAVMVLTHTAFTSMRLALTLAVLQQGGSALAVGVIVSLLMVVPVFSSIAIGRWTDRAGHVPAALAGLALIVVGGLVATRQVLPALACGAVLIGSGQAMVQVAIMDAIGQGGGEGAARRFSALSLGFSVSGFFGPILTGLAIDHAGHALAFFTLCLPASAAWLLALRSAPAAARAPATAPRGTAGALWADPRLRAVLLVTALLAMAWDLFTFVMPVHGTRLGLSATAIGTVAGSFAAGCFSIRLVLGRLAARLGERRILWGALTGTAMCYALFPLAGGLPAMAVLAYVIGLFLGSGQPMAMSLLHRSAPAGRSGEVMGVRTVIVSISQTALPLVFGALGAALGTGPVFLAVAAAMGSGMAWVRRSSPR
ncbi:MFS transporter [Xenophilus azovorans]|uniref:MFS transporter n=1 Tax=Xenophilus azovorans TaxID=151755 RepID=UPI000571CC20|nr:MFS transporter [Xenophilus azovorans]